MPRTVYPAIPLTSYRERQAYVSHTRICPSHTCAVQCNPPFPSIHSLIPLIRPYFWPSWVRLRPFWYHLPLTRRSFTLLGDFTYTYARVHTYTSIHAPSRRKVLQVMAKGRDDKEGEEKVAEETIWGRGGRAYSGILRAARGRRWKKRCRFEERWGWGSDLISIVPSPLFSLDMFRLPFSPHRAARSSLVTSFEPRCNFPRWNAGTDFSKTPQRFFVRYNLYRESLQQEALELFRRDAILREDNIRPPLTKPFINIRLCEFPPHNRY